MSQTQNNYILLDSRGNSLACCRFASLELAKLFARIELGNEGVFVRRLVVNENDVVIDNQVKAVPLSKAE